MPVLKQGWLLKENKKKCCLPFLSTKFDRRYCVLASEGDNVTMLEYDSNTKEVKYGSHVIDNMTTVEPVTLYGSAGLCCTRPTQNIGITIFNDLDSISYYFDYQDVEAAEDERERWMYEFLKATGNLTAVMADFLASSDS